MSHLAEVEIKPKSHELFTAISGTEGVELIRKVAANMRQRLDGRVIWNINTTASGGSEAQARPLEAIHAAAAAIVVPEPTTNAV